MILLPDYSTPKHIGSGNYRLFSEKFHVCYKPLAWTDTGSSAPAQGYSLEELSSGVYNEWCRWDSGTVFLKGSFGGERVVDTILLGKPSFDYLKGNLKWNGRNAADVSRASWLARGKTGVRTDRGEIIVFDTYPDGRLPVTRRLAPEQEKLQQADQEIVAVKLWPTLCDGFELEFIGASPVTLNKFYIGEDTEFSLASSLAYPLKGRGKGGMTDTGVAYGTKYPPFRVLKATWDLLDDRDRRIIEEYICAVQNVDAHFIIPVAEDFYIPPMFVQMQTQETGNSRQKAEWYWEGISLEWTEAK